MKTLSTDFTLRKRRNGEYTLYDKSCEMRYVISQKLHNFLRLFIEQPLELEQFLFYLETRNIDTSDLYECLGKSEFRNLFIPFNPEHRKEKIENRDIYTYKNLGIYTEYSPERIDLLLTRTCNLTCKHCFEYSSPTETTTFISFERLKTLAQEMEDLNIQTIKITGGEALMYPKIKELLEAFARKRFETIILTNAMKLSRELCDIIARGKMKLGISLDGHIACEHDYIRGDGAFRILLEKFKLIHEFGIHFSVTITVHSHNVNSLDAIIMYALQELGADVVFINKLRPLGRAKQHKDIFISWEQDKYVTELIDKLTNIYGENTILYSDDDADMPLCTNTELAPATPLLCAAGNTLLSIDNKLDVYPCVYGHDQQEFLIGNLYRESLLDIWHSPKWERLRGKTLLQDIPSCLTCKRNAKCGLKNCRLKATYEGLPFLSHVSYCNPEL